MLMLKDPWFTDFSYIPKDDILADLIAAQCPPIHFAAPTLHEGNPCAVPVANGISSRKARSCEPVDGA